MVDDAEAWGCRFCPSTAWCLGRLAVNDEAPA
jgi:hypothetical protein